LRRLVLGAALLATGLWVDPVGAAEAPEAAAFQATAKRPSEGDFDGMIETLIITGQKRGEPTQHVPVALTQISAKDFVKSNTRRLDGGQERVPNRL
jgi:hypothetical protein